MPKEKDNDSFQSKTIFALKVIFVILILLWLFQPRVELELKPQVQLEQNVANQKSSVPITKTDFNEKTDLVKKLENAYTQYQSVDFSKVDCNDPDQYDTDLMDVNLFDARKYQDYSTGEWYPSLGEGKFTLFYIQLKNVGCTIIKPKYVSFISLDGNLIYYSQKNDFQLTDYMYPNGFYPKDWYVGNGTVNGLYGYPQGEDVKVYKKGHYILWIYVTNESSNKLVAIKKLDFNFG